MLPFVMTQPLRIQRYNWSCNLQLTKNPLQTSSSPQHRMPRLGVQVKQTAVITQHNNVREVDPAQRGK